MGHKIRVNISISEETHQKLKRYAAGKGLNVSQAITELVWQEDSADDSLYTCQCKRTIQIGTDTDERLEQWAYENHTTVDQAITDWIWKQKVRGSSMKGQYSFC